MSWQEKITKERFPILSNYDMEYLEEILTGLLKASNKSSHKPTDNQLLMQANLLEMDLERERY